MQHTYSSFNKDSLQNWQVLGELQLVLGTASYFMVRKWLAVTLGLLELRDDLKRRVRQSAQEAVSRAMRAESMLKGEHIHLLVLIPESDELNNQNWSFFRIEKIENQSDQVAPDHTIEFYLYQDG